MKAYSLIVATLIFAMVLSIMVLPPWLLWVRPEFTLMVLVYWVLAIPERFGLVSAMVVGLFQDSLTASLMGKHMLAYTLVIVFILFTYQRLRMLGVWQQALIVFFLLAAEQFVECRIAGLTGQPEAGAWFLVPALTGALLWPWLLVSLSTMRRKTGVLNRLI